MSLADLLLLPLGLALLFGGALIGSLGQREGYRVWDRSDVERMRGTGLLERQIRFQRRAFAALLMVGMPSAILWFIVH